MAPVLWTVPRLWGTHGYRYFRVAVFGLHRGPHQIKLPPLLPAALRERGEREQELTLALAEALTLTLTLTLTPTLTLTLTRRESEREREGLAPTDARDPCRQLMEDSP